MLLTTLIVLKCAFDNTYCTWSWKYSPSPPPFSFPSFLVNLLLVIENHIKICQLFYSLYDIEQVQTRLSLLRVNLFWLHEVHTVLGNTDLHESWSTYKCCGTPCLAIFFLKIFKALSAKKIIIIIFLISSFITNNYGMREIIAEY